VLHGFMFNGIQEKAIMPLFFVLGLSVSGSCCQNRGAFLNVLVSVFLFGCVKSSYMSAVNEPRLQERCQITNNSGRQCVGPRGLRYVKLYRFVDNVFELQTRNKRKSTVCGI